MVHYLYVIARLAEFVLTLIAIVLIYGIYIRTAGKLRKSIFLAMVGLGLLLSSEIIDLFLLSTSPTLTGAFFKDFSVYVTDSVIRSDILRDLFLVGILLFGVIGIWHLRKCVFDLCKANGIKLPKKIRKTTV